MKCTWTQLMAFKCGVFLCSHYLRPPSSAAPSPPSIVPNAIPNRILSVSKPLQILAGRIIIHHRTHTVWPHLLFCHRLPINAVRFVFFIWKLGFAYAFNIFIINTALIHVGTEAETAERAHTIARTPYYSRTSYPLYCILPSSIPNHFFFIVTGTSGNIRWFCIGCVFCFHNSTFSIMVQIWAIDEK